MLINVRYVQDALWRFLVNKQNIYFFTFNINTKPILKYFKSSTVLIHICSLANIFQSFVYFRTQIALSLCTKAPGLNLMVGCGLCV